MVMMNDKVKDENMKTTVTFDSASGKFIGSLNGKIVVRSKYESAVRDRLAEMNGSVVEAEKAIEAKNEKYGINERFGFVEKLVVQVVSKAKFLKFWGINLIIRKPGNFANILFQYLNRFTRIVLFIIGKWNILPLIFCYFSCSNNGIFVTVAGVQINCF